MTPYGPQNCDHDHYPLAIQSGNGQCPIQFNHIPMSKKGNTFVADVQLRRLITVEY